MTESLRIGLAGYGFGGHVFHAPMLASVETCDFLGVVTTSAERRTLVVADHPGVTTFDSLDALAAAGAEAVAISTPADTHSRLTDEALALGLHVVCDKPFALDAAAAARSVELAAQRGRVLSPYQNRRWDSDFLTLRHLVERGRLGNVVRMESRFERFVPDRDPKPAGGGTLLDFGSHLIDQALVVLGPVDTVYAEWTIRDNGLDDDVFVALAHTNGARSHHWGSSRQPAPGPRFRVAGTEAAYVIDGPMDGQEASLVAGDTPRSLGDQWGGGAARGGVVLSAATRSRSCHRHPARGPPSTGRSRRQCAATASHPYPRPTPSRLPRVLDATRTSATTGDTISLA